MWITLIAVYYAKIRQKKMRFDKVNAKMSSTTLLMPVRGQRL